MLMKLAYLVFACGLISIAAILHDAFEVMMLPRRVKSKMRIVRYFFSATWAFWRATGKRLKTADKRHNFLGLYGALFLLLLLETERLPPNIRAVSAWLGRAFGVGPARLDSCAGTGGPLGQQPPAARAPSA
jgi:hypothetical protein